MKFLNGSTVYQCGSGLNSNVTNNLEFVWSDPVGTTIGHRTVMTYPDGTNKTAYTGSLNLWIGNQSKYGYDNGFAEHDQGIYSYTVADENAAGQWSAPAPACTLIYETSIPTATLTQPVPTIVNKNFQVAATASDNVMLQNVFFDVRSQDGSKWVSGCVVGSFNINYTDNNKQASLGCTINTSSLVNGTTYLLRVHASNYAGYGNVNSASQSYFTYDNANLTAPTGGTPNMTSTRNDFYFKWNASTGALAGWPVKYELIASQDKTAVQNADMSKVWDSVRDGAGSGQGNLTTPTDHSTGAGDGVWYWSVRAFDAAGNQSPWSDVWSVTVDNTAPVVSITSPNNGDVVNGTVTVSGTVTDNNPDHYYFVVKDSTGKVVAGPGVVNQANVTSWNWDTTKFTDGIYTIDLEARDAAGNKDANSVQTINVVVDNMKPTVLLDAITSPVGGFTKNLDITGKVNDANLASYQLIATDDATGVVVADTGVIPTTTGGAINPYAWDVSTLPSGTYTVTLTATDVLGQSSSQSQDVTVNNTPPTIIYNAADNSATGNKITPSITVTDPNTPYTASWTANTSNPVGAIYDSTSIDPTFTLLNSGTYKYTLTVTDALGNTSSQPVTFSYTAPLLTKLTQATTTTPLPITPPQTTNTTNTGDNTVADTTGQVLGAQTTKPNPDDKGSVKGATTTKSTNNNNTWSFLGLAWYWWLLILAVIAAIWWFLAARNRRSEQSA
jgi:disulfide bond formation protein DsbB